MNVGVEQRRFDRSRLFAQGAAVTCAAVGASALIGWWLDIPALKSILAGAATMKPLTAMCFVLIGLALWLNNVALDSDTKRGQRSWQALAAYVSCVIVTLIALLTLIQDATGKNLRFDQFLFPGALAATGQINPGRMALATALALLLLGIALISQRIQTGKGWRLDQILALIVIALAGLALEGYLFGIEQLYRVRGYSSMAVHTALLLFILSLGVLFSRPTLGLMATVTSQRVGGMVARRFLPVVILLPVIGGWLRLQGELAGWYAGQFGLALFVTANVVGLACVVWISSRHLNSLDAQRIEASTNREENEARLAGIIASAMDGIITIDEQQRIMLFNPAAEKMFGYPAEELIGQPIDRLIPKRFRAAHKKHVEKFGETHVTRRSMGALGALYGLRADGEEFPIEASISQIESDGQKLYTVILRDISERKRAEEALKEQARILDLAPVLILDLDGRIIFWNTGAVQMYGWKSEEALEKVSRDLLKTEFPQPEEEIKARLLSRGHWEGELVHTTKDGRRLVIASHWVLHRDEHGKPKAILEVNNDVTERKCAEQELIHQSNLTKTITDNAASCLFMMDKQGHPTFMNPAAEDLTGYILDEIKDKPLHDAVHYRRPDGSPYPMSECPIDNASAELVPMRDQEETFVRKDGSLFPVSYSVAPLDRNGETIGAVLEFRDVSDGKRAEEEIRQLNAELEQRVIERTAELRAVNKELEAFSYSVSHDLRAPLRHINGFSQALLEDYAHELDDGGKLYLDEVRSASQEMAKLIDDLLQLARISRGEMRREDVNLSELASSVIEDLKKTNGRRNVTVEIRDGLKTRGDKRLLRVVLTNLLGNAWKFTSRQNAAEIHFGRAERNGEQVYVVRDNGAGFDMAYANKLFGAFQRLHTVGEFEGTGIGLATVQRVIGRHGGRVWAEGVVDEGATFYFTLPNS